MRIDLLTTKKLPKTSKTQNSTTINSFPEKIPDAPEVNTVSEITALTNAGTNAREHKTPVKLSRLLLYFCWGVFLLCALFFLLGEYFDYEFSAGELISIQNELDEYKVILDEECDLQNIHQDIRGRETEVAKISSLYSPHLSILNNLSNSLPSGVWLTWFQSNAKGDVIVKGQSHSFAKVGDYLKRLKEIDFFVSLQLKEIKRQTTKASNFLFTIELKTGGASLEYAE